ncbi:hypothetical protein [Curtobacterium sp. C2H10]|uniref:hypothetical protein n=1 Tax=Curtobacterium sp. C2H10 TaxID=2736664 RepID=UPI0021BEFF06|nr:hypothetical protein [Curtobacterium sp. C2H10]MCT9620520.1 hypothetical protein [Curtobacterium sp. C2H10]
MGPTVAQRIKAALHEMTNAPDRVFGNADRHRRINGYSGSDATGTEEALGGNGSNADRLDAVGAAVHAMFRLEAADNEEVDVSGWNRDYEQPRYQAAEFAAIVNDILLGSRVDWAYAEGYFQPRGNHVLHQQLIKPASVLLDSDPKFTPASQGLQLAISRLSNDSTDAAITDAASAVQEFFRALGVDGNSISDQLNVATTQGIISAVDRKLLMPIVTWVNADRSERGNAHHHRDGDVSRADAWLMIHVASALIVRLSGQEPRDILAAREKRDELRLAAEQQRLEEEAAAALAEQTRNTQRLWGSPYDDETPF